MKKTPFLILILLFPLSTFNHMQAQGRFDAEVFAGLNMGQIDGDDAGRFNHPGLRAGVGTSWALDDTWRPVIQLAYTQKGSVVGQINRRLSADYIEVALMMSYNAMNDRLRLAAGVAPAVLVRAEVTDNGTHNQLLTDDFRSVDWLPLTLAASYRFSDHLFLEARWQNSMLSISKDNSSGTYRIFRSNGGSFHRLVSFGLGYRF